MIRRLLLLLSLTVSALAQPLVRVPNTTLAMPEQPGAFGYTMTRVFPDLVFQNAVAIVTPPGETNRLFILERRGRVAVVTNLAEPTRTVFLDISARVRLDNFNEMGLLGIAFHPQYAVNGRFFLFYTCTATTTGAVSQRHNRLSEFRASATDPNRGNAGSERILFQQFDEGINHNGGDLHFGPDGYLYVALGDEGGANDTYNNSQRIDRDLFAAMARIDVDLRPGSLPPNPHPAVTTNYAIPADNPFVGATNFLGRAVDPTRVRTEFWSVGLRNPWRNSFDDATGDFWIADVGQDAREAVFVSRAGANHGWAFREGELAGPRSGAPAGFTTNPAFQYVAPIWTYPHVSGTGGGFSVTGGFVYRGSRLGQLFGAYILADYVTGNVWALRRPSGGGRGTATRLTGYANIAAFGPDPRNGDVLAANHETGHIVRLDYNSTFTGARLPEQLSQTGAFRDLATLDPQPGLVPYDVNLPFWSDAAAKRRWFSIPDTNRFIQFNRDDAWLTPPGTVWVKHFDLERTNGVPASARRLETRFLVRNASGVYGATYRWNEAQTDAVLVPEAGDDEALVVADMSGLIRTQIWRYPSRAECLVCHNPAAGGSLSFLTAQWNRDFVHGGVMTNQISALAAAGYFQTPPPSPATLPAVARPEDESVSVTWRAKSWLAVNCASCHRAGGFGGAQFDARLDVPLDRAGILLGALNNSAATNRRLVIPGEIGRSELHARLAVRGPGQMPPLASSIIDPAGERLIARWIADHARGDSFATWAAQVFPDPAAPNAAREADPDLDGRTNFGEFILGSSPATADGLWRVTLVGESTAIRLEVSQPANRAVVIEASADPVAGIWTPVDAGGQGRVYPAAARTLSVVQPVADAARFFRARLEAP
jgi:glucose/arabinose dehydrogenase/mono/diheme cytochrome c family protein